MSQCKWPALNPQKEDINIPVDTVDKPVKVMFIADTHLLGSREGHWFDKLRRFHRSSITSIKYLFVQCLCYIISIKK